MAPSVLAALPLGGRGVTGDALSGPTALCRQIRRQGGDYLVTIKANQPDPRWAVQTVFATPPHGERFATAVAWEQHGDRGETRRLWASTALRDYLTWPGAARVIMVERVCRRRDRRTREVRDCLTSLGPAVAPAALRDPIRGHWRLENRLHWVRDVAWGEDASQVRSGSAPQLLAALRNTVLGRPRGAGGTTIAAALRHDAWPPGAALAVLGLTPP